VVWKRNLFADFQTKPPKWGMSVSPLIVDGKLIVAPGSPAASLAALDPASGKTLWTSPGRPAAYASLVAGIFGGRNQLVGYDATTLGGWEITTGRRLWHSIPEIEGDFNVPTPVPADGHLVVSTENNGTRLFTFADDGTIQQEPLAQHPYLAPDTTTPVAVAGKLFGSCGGELFCLDLEHLPNEPNGALRVLWTGEDDAYSDHVSIFGHPERILIASCDGQLLLVSTREDRYQLISRMRVFGEDCELLSHPALVGTRLVLRNGSHLVCLELRED
jgi:hypothetical protein